MNAKLQTIIDEAKARVAAEKSNGREKINVCIDSSSIARGAEETLAKIREVVEAKGLRADVGVTGSWGFCWMEPTVTVRSAAGTQTVLYANVTADRVEEFLDATVAKSGTMPELALGVVEGTATDDIPLLSDHPFMQGQTRRLMEFIGPARSGRPRPVPRGWRVRGLRCRARNERRGHRQPSGRKRPRRPRGWWLPGRTEMGFPPNRNGRYSLPRLQRR